MKKHKTLLLIGLLVFLTSFQKKGNWVDFNSSEFAFKILIPKEPSFLIKEISTENGPMKMNIFAYQPSAEDKDVNTFYGINISDYANNSLNFDNSEELNDFFKASIEGSVKSVAGELVYEEIINFNGYPGRDYRVLLRNGTVALRTKMIVVKSRVYMITTITDTRNDFKTAITRFMDSFELIKK